MIDLIHPITVEFCDVHLIKSCGLLWTHANFNKLNSLRQINNELIGMHTGKIPCRNKRMRFLHQMKAKINQEPDYAKNILCKYSTRPLEIQPIESPVYYIHVSKNQEFILNRRFINNSEYDFFYDSSEEDVY